MEVEPPPQAQSTSTISGARGAGGSAGACERGGASHALAADGEGVSGGCASGHRGGGGTSRDYGETKTRSTACAGEGCGLWATGSAVRDGESAGGSSRRCWDEGDVDGAGAVGCWQRVAAIVGLGEGAGDLHIGNLQSDGARVRESHRLGGACGAGLPVGKRKACG
jgi:hypothetical protein